MRGFLRTIGVSAAIAVGAMPETMTGTMSGAPDEEPARSARDLRDEVFYHVMPIAFRDSDAGEAGRAIDDPDAFGDFGGMTAALPYLHELGITAVWMNPPFPSRAYHGYQHGAAERIEPRLGGDAAFHEFVREAHALGIRVFVDFVAYGISREDPRFQDAFGNPASVYDGWFAFENAENTRVTGYTFRTWDGAAVGFAHFDLRNPSVRRQVGAWAARWLDPDGDGDPRDGIDGFRLDHVWARYPTRADGPSASLFAPGSPEWADGWGYHLEPFWREWREALERVNPGVLIFAEQARWETHGEDLLGVFDAAFTKPLEFAAREALRAERAEPLRREVARTVAALERAGRGTFLATIGNHDVDRLASEIGATTPETMGRARAAAAVLMLQPFAPVIYMGDEIGMLGRKARLSGDGADIPRREPFKWRATDGPPMSDYWAGQARAKASRASGDHDGRSVEEQAGTPGSLLETYRELIALRHAHAALRRGGYAEVETCEEAAWAFRRPMAGAREAWVAINLGPAALTLPSPRGRWEHACGGDQAGPDVVVEGYSWVVLLEADSTGSAAAPGRG